MLGFSLTTAAVMGIVRVIFAGIGISIVSFAGGTAAIAAVRTLIINETNLLDTATASILGLARVDDAFSIQFMFLGMRLTIAGFKKLKII
jgi:hypothetical protein